MNTNEREPATAEERWIVRYRSKEHGKSRYSIKRKMLAALRVTQEGMFPCDCMFLHRLKLPRRLRSNHEQ